jgi:hypothetical protein
MNRSQRGVVVGVAVLAALLVVAVMVWPASRVALEKVAVGAADAGAAEAQPPSALAELRRAAPPPSDAGELPSATVATRVLARFGWGEGEGQLGRLIPADESNPEAPMSLAVDARGAIVLLDQVNNRLVKLKADGTADGTLPLTVQGAQDVVVAKDGTVAVLDRLSDRTVALYGPDGKPAGELELVGKGVEDPGDVTGLFTDGNDVLVEREHGDTVKLGDTKGAADPARPEFPGRPSRDGQAYLTAGIADAAEGRVTVTAVERKGGARRFTREYRFGALVFSLMLLDSDSAGIIYLVAQIDGPKADAPLLTMLCLDPVDGRPLGRALVAANTGAEETMRELSVLDSGGVLYLRRTEQGSQLMRLDCQ